MSFWRNVRFKPLVAVVAVVVAASLGSSLFATRVLADKLGLQATAVSETDVGPGDYHDHETTSGAVTFKKVQTKVGPITTSSRSFVQFSVMTVPVPPGTHLIDGRWTGETQCTENNTVGNPESNWCTMRIMVNGWGANPQAYTDFAMDSTNQAREQIGSWESHSVQRTRCFQNTTNSTINIPVSVEMAVVNTGNDSDVPSMWVSNWSFSVERSAGCSPVD